MSTNVGKIDLAMGLNYKDFNRDLKNIAPKATSLIQGGFGRLGKMAAAAFGARALLNFTKSAIQMGSDVAEVQNVVDVTFGAMSKDIQEFANTSIESFGMNELVVKRYASTMGAMLKSTGIKGTKFRDMSLDITRLTADMASFYNLENDDMFEKIMSGMSGMAMPLKKLGIDMGVANLEAFALAEGLGKTYANMNQAEKSMLRYSYLMSVTKDQQGDFSRTSHGWAQQLKILDQQWQTLKGTLGQGFINILAPIIRGFNVVIKKIQIAAEYFRAFTVLLFGNTQAAKKTGTNLGYVADSAGGAGKALGGAGKAAKKAGKDAKGSIAGFDEVNILMQSTADAAGDLGDGLDEGIGGIPDIDLGEASDGELDIDISKIEGKFSTLKNWLNDFYTNWGAKDLFEGFRAGLDLVNFDKIRADFTRAFEGLSEIAQTALIALQPIYKAAGEALGTALKYGIAIVGNLFEPIVEGFANFVDNMKEPIQIWLLETSDTIVNGFNNVNTIFEIVGQSWLNSIDKYKSKISEETEKTFTNIANTFMLIGTIFSDTFELITGNLKTFVENNLKDIQDFTDNILGMFTDLWALVNKVWEDALKILKDFWDDWGKDIVDGAMRIVTDIAGWFLYLWNEGVKPVWDNMMKWITKIWDESLKGIVEELVGFVGRVGDLIVKVWDGILAPLIDKILKTFVPAFRDAFNTALDIVGSVVNGIGGIIKNLLKILNGIIDFVVGVFTGDWRRAWQGISNVFKGIVDGLVAIFKVPLNLIITGINAFLKGINKISIPDWVPGIGGKGFNISEIPHLAKGGIISQPTVAMIGEAGKEAVVPLENNTGWMDIMANLIASKFGPSEGSGGNGNPIMLTVKIGEDTLLEYLLDLMDRESILRGETIIPI